MLASQPRTQGSIALATGVLAGLTFASYPLGAKAVIAAFFCGVLVVIAAIDVRCFRIPNTIVLPSTMVMLLANVALTPSRAGEFLLAALLAGVLLLLPALKSSAWMGMGDVKLGLLLGAALGWAVFGALEIAFIAVLPVALLVRVRGGQEACRTPLPFAPFLAFGALVVLILPRLTEFGG